MPIKNKSLYPDNWSQISRSIRERAGHRCEGSPAYPDCRAENRKPHPVTGSLVILTIGHLNHNPRDCSDDNLRCWCQRCHLTYDGRLHARNAAATRRNRRALGDLFDADV